MDRNHREKRAGKSKGMVHAERDVTFRDFLIFQLKLVLDGIKDLVLFNVSIGAMVLDLIAGRGRRPRLFYSVLRASERFDLWLNLNGAMERIDANEDEGDGLFGASTAGSDTLLGRIEQLVRGGDEPRGGREVPVGSSEREGDAEREGGERGVGDRAQGSTGSPDGSAGSGAEGGASGA